jgi:hypothetical protein
MKLVIMLATNTAKCANVEDWYGKA